MVHMLEGGELWLRPGKPVMNHSSGKHLHTSASLMKNTKKKTCPAWKLPNNKSQAGIKYCIEPQCTDPAEFGLTPLPLTAGLSVFCVSSIMLLSRWLQIQLSLRQVLPPEMIWNYERMITQRQKKTSPGFNIAIYTPLFRFKWSLDGWGKIRFEGVAIKLIIIKENKNKTKVNNMKL